MKVNIKGDIIPNDYKRVYDYLKWDGACPNDIHKAVAEAEGDELEVHVASGGGSMYAGVEMFNALRDYKGSVKTYIDSHAHSAASFFSCAGHCIMNPGSLMMVHRVSSGAEGNASDMSHAAEVLEQHDEAVITIYMSKTRQPRPKLLALMERETYLTANEALELGFADEIAGVDALQPVAAATHFLTQEQIAKIEALIPAKLGNNPDKPDKLALARARLKLLKLEARQ